MVKDQLITDEYSLYNGDNMEVMGEMQDNSVDMFIYSLPFVSMYVYSSSDRDLGNRRNYEEFLDHYTFIVKEIYRVVKLGRIVCVHCMDIPLSGDMGLNDFPGDLISLHKKNGFKYWDRKSIWKEPLRVAIRTRQRCLTHQQLCRDSLKCRGVIADTLLIFKKKGENIIPVENPYGLTEYAGDLELMNKLEREEYNSLIKKYVNYKDDKTNKLSQFIWRRYASSLWEDIRANVCLQYKPARDKDDDRHVCPLALDVITRAIILYTNKGEIVVDPFDGIGSSVYASVMEGRKGVGIELKKSYHRQAVKNLRSIKEIKSVKDKDLYFEYKR